MPGNDGPLVGNVEWARQWDFELNQARFEYLLNTEYILTIKGDVDGSGIIDRADVNLLLSHNSQEASECPACDLDGNGIINVLDARRLVLLCELPRCAIQ